MTCRHGSDGPPGCRRCRYNARETRSRWRRHRERLAQPEVKVCERGHRFTPSDYVTGKCRHCVREYNRAYYAQNAERVLARVAAAHRKRQRKAI